MSLADLLHEPITRFLAQLIAIVLTSRILSLFVRQLGQPIVVAEITAGILLGPSCLGLFAPEWGQALFPASSLGVLNLVAQLGLVLFMFLIGLELDLRLLRGRGHSSVLISHTSIIFPFALGWLVAYFAYPIFAPAGVTRTTFGLFLGIAMSITAFPVLARILTERRLLSTRVGAISIACAAVDDVTAWCILAFVVATARAAGLESAVWTTAMALAYMFFMYAVVRPLLGRLASRVTGRPEISQDVVAGTLLILFLSSWTTEVIGIHALFGAFILGVIIPKQGGFARAMAEKLEDLVIVVLLPLFFAFSGVRTQIGLLDQREDWIWCAVFIGLACVGKFGGSVLAARITGLGWRESNAIGVLMNTRGLMELIVLNIGLDLGVIGPELFTMMVIMALFTTGMTTPLLQWIYPPSLQQRDAQADEVVLEPIGDSHPAIKPENPPILVWVDHQGSGPDLLRIAAALRPEASPPTPIYAIEIVAPSVRASSYLELPVTPANPPTLDPLLELADSQKWPVSPISFVSNDAADDLCRIVQVKAADLLLVEWHRPLFAQSMLGGTVHSLLSEAPCTVGVLFARPLHQPLRKILVPFQGSKQDRAALRLALRVQEHNASVLTILVVQPQGAAHKANDPAVAEELANFAQRPNVRLVRAVHGSPERAVLAACSDGVDLIVVGIGASWGLQPRLFGMTPETLLRDSPASLLVVRDALERTTSPQQLSSKTT